MRSPAEASPSIVFAPELGAPAGRVTLSPEESHYLSRVCRAKPGDTVSATDGRGGLASLRLDAVGRECTATIVTIERHERTREAELWCGVPEAERADWLVEKLAELGVARLVLLDTERGEWRRSAARRERWERVARAALRQSRQLWALEIAGPFSLAAGLAAAGPSAERFVADPHGESAGEMRATGASHVIGVVGPAAGLADLERGRLAGEGFRPVALGASRLRTETAAVALAAWFSFQD